MDISVKGVVSAPLGRFARTPPGWVVSDPTSSSFFVLLPIGGGILIINISYDINYQKEADAISTDLLKRTRAAVLAGSVRITAHAMARLVERGFSLPDVERVLKNGFHDQARGAMVPNGVWRDRIEGKTVDGKTIKLAVEVNGDVTLVTVID